MKSLSARTRFDWSDNDQFRQKNNRMFWDSRSNDNDQTIPSAKETAANVNKTQRDVQCRTAVTPHGALHVQQQRQKECNRQRTFTKSRAKNSTTVAAPLAITSMPATTVPTVTATDAPPMHSRRSPARLWQGDRRNTLRKLSTECTSF